MDLLYIVPIGPLTCMSSSTQVVVFFSGLGGQDGDGRWGERGASAACARAARRRVATRRRY